jgi:hypothetical protein
VGHRDPFALSCYALLGIMHGLLVQEDTVASVTSSSHRSLRNICLRHVRWRRLYEM